jgi:hypothetical protein
VVGRTLKFYIDDLKRDEYPVRIQEVPPIGKKHLTKDA